jgi:hypothetical protein
MEAASTSETLVNVYQTTRRNNPEDSHLQKLVFFAFYLSILFGLITDSRAVILKSRGVIYHKAVWEETEEHPQHPHSELDSNPRLQVCQLNTRYPLDRRTCDVDPGGVPDLQANGEVSAGRNNHNIIRAELSFRWVPLYGVPLNHESKTEDFLFSVLQSVNRADTVNMKSPPLMMVIMIIIMSPL